MAINTKIRLSRSIVGSKEAAAVKRLLMDDGYLGMGQEVRRFEEELRLFLGGKRKVVCVNSGTAALHLAVMAVVKPGGEVLVPSLTFVACFQVIKAVGAVPVACDIDPETLLLDLDDAKRRLTPRTKAIMPVHYSGGIVDPKALSSFARKHGLRVIEDAAHAFGTTWQGKRVGSFGDIVCFSFDGIKNITSGEGGAVVSDDKKVMTFVKDARLLGVQKDTEKRFSGQRSWEFEITHQGYRYHMSNILAAVGRVQLGRFAEFAGKRQALARRYEQELSGLAGVTLIPRDFVTVVPHLFPVLVAGGKRDALRAFLVEKGIETGIHYYPNHRLAYFKRVGKALPNTDKVYAQIMSLPLHPGLTRADQDRVIKNVREFFSHG